MTTHDTDTQHAMTAHETASDQEIRFVTNIEMLPDSGTHPVSVIESAWSPRQIVDALATLDPEDLADVVAALGEEYAKRWGRSVIVPLEHVGPGVHVLGHVGLTDEGYRLLKRTLQDAALNAPGDEAGKLGELHAVLTSD